MRSKPDPGLAVGSLPLLRDVFLAHRGKLSDKWEQYLGIYESELYFFRRADRPIRLLEVGVQNGGSLEIWKSYLPEGSTVLGLDVDERVSSLTFGTDRVAAKICDASNEDKIRSTLGATFFDVIIDDGSHLSSDIIKTLSLLFAHLAPGGRYIIEDLHCSYYASYGGGYRKANSAIEWLKSLVDAQNIDHISPGVDVSSEELERLSSYAQWMARITFYDSVAVIEKLYAPKTRPYRRLMSGLDDTIQPFREQLLSGTFPDPSSVWLGPALARQLDQDASKRISYLREKNDLLADTVAKQQSTLDLLNAEREQMMAAFELRHRQLELSLDEANLACRTIRGERDNLARELRDAILSADERESNIQTQYRQLRMKFVATEAERAKSRRRVGASIWYGLMPLSMRIRKEERALLRTDLFDEKWYLEQYPAVRGIGLSPTEHFLQDGYLHGFRPNRVFDPLWYLETYDDVRKSGMNPLIHYALYGYKEGRNPSSDFFTETYLDANPEVGNSGINPLAHFLRSQT
jgi:hypothetical protein